MAQVSNIARIMPVFLVRMLYYDETHLDPAFQKLLEEITKMQSHELMKLRVMSMTATMRPGGKFEAI